MNFSSSCSRSRDLGLAGPEKVLKRSNRTVFRLRATVSTHPEYPCAWKRKLFQNEKEQSFRAFRLGTVAASFPRLEERKIRQKSLILAVESRRLAQPLHFHFPFRGSRDARDEWGYSPQRPCVPDLRNGGVM
jgi:hypothetical protein